MPQTKKNNVHVLMMMPDYLKLAGKNAARRDCLSLSAYIRKLIINDLASRGIAPSSTTKNQ